MKLIVQLNIENEKPEKVIHVVGVGVHNDVSNSFLLDFSENISEKKEKKKVI
jgi:hypothetical protein